MNSRFEVTDVLSVEYLENSIENSIHAYLDEREEVLWESVDLDIEVFREVSALYRVIRCLIDKSGIRPMPNAIKRMFYLKRRIYDLHRKRITRKRFTSRSYL